MDMFLWKAWMYKLVKLNVVTTTSIIPVSSDYNSIVPENFQEKLACSQKKLENSFQPNFKSLNPLTPVLAITGRDQPWPFFLFWRHYFWPKLHHLYSISAGGKDLFNDAQIRVIGLMEPEICTKKLKKLSEKLRAKFPSTTPGCSMVKFGPLSDASWEGF